MGYVFDFKDVKNYHRWIQDSRTQLILDLESRLMLRMLHPNPGEAVLDIGCGTGWNLKQLIEKGVKPTGLDASVYMLDVAEREIGHRADLHHGYAEELPFDDNTFNHAIFMTSLEFVENPQRAIEEACRVAKDKVFIGTLNRYAIKSVYRRLEGVFRNTIYNRAKFFGIWELRDMVRGIMGPAPVKWRTTCQLPLVSKGWSLRLERASLVQHCPFGAFVGMAVTLVPRFRTRPLSLKLRSKGTPKTVAG